MSCKVHLHPLNKTVEVEQGETLLEGLRRSGIYIKSSCGGMATCSDCKVKVRFGEDFITPPTFGEIRLLGNVFHITKERLSCQMKIHGDVTLDVSDHDQRYSDQAMRAASSALKKVAAPAPTILKKSAQVEVEKQAKTQLENEEKKKEEGRWYRHWEKKDDDKEKNNKRGGGRRPRRFKYKNEHEE